jgi:predicted O-methyltransferase YrrM
MSQDTWTAVDTYLAGELVGADPALDAATEASNAAGLPAIAVSPVQGKFLAVLAGAVGARRVLEIGTLGGYSTIWLARALAPGGRLISLELDPKHAEVARANLQRAGVAGAVEVRVGPAIEALPRLAAEGGPPFDFVFIDADKQSSTEYFDWAVRLARPGALVVVDNVVRKGAVADAHSSDERVLGMRRLFQHVHGDGRVQATALQTVGSKGYDGFLLARVL